jgi:rhodanese-related sulfurtransferase
MRRARNIFEQLQQFEEQFSRLETRILQLDLKIENLVNIQRNHLIRLKNQEEVSDEFIMNGRSYQDLSPEQAWKLYSDQNFDFILIDVSSRNFHPAQRIPEARHLPWEDFLHGSLDILNKTTPLLIISEDGTRSILACEFLVKRGFYNCNNISGGYEYWKGFAHNEAKDQSA